MKATYRYLFNRRNEDSNEKTIELEAYFGNNVRKIITTRIKIEEKYWDKTRQEVSKKHPLSVEYNQYLNDFKMKLQREEWKMLEAGHEWNIKTLNTLLKDLANNKRGDFVAFCHTCNHDELAANAIKFTGWKKYNTDIIRLEKYAKVKNLITEARHFDFADFDLDFIYNLDLWAQQEGYADSTIKKFHVNLRKYIRKAIKQGYMKQDPYDNYKFRAVKTSERINLTEDELARLENLDRSELQAVDAHLVAVLDRFLFSCYCGLRISDSLLLETKHIIKSEHGYVVDMVTEKMNGKRVILPVDLLFNGKGGEILRRYLKDEEGVIFPKLSEQKINQKLKVLALISGVRQKLTFHIARHTCATLLAEKTYNPFIVMQILGHSDIKTSMIYIHNSTQAVVRGLQEAKW